MTDLDDTTNHQIKIINQISLADQAARSFKWAFLYNFIPRLITPFSTIILAALLTPADFGLVAVSTFVIALARILVNMGLGKTIIQRKILVDEAASVSFLLSLFVSLCLYAILWIFAPAISLAYNDNRIIDVIRIAALSLPLTAIGTIPSALMQRNMEFQNLFWVNASSLIGQAVLSVILAFAGYRYWSLIWGQLFGYVLGSSLAWKLTHWRPIIMTNWVVLRSVVKFSLWVMVSNFQNWLSLYADNAIAGLFLATHGLGIYALGFNIATIIPGFMIDALADVAYPSFCKLQGNPQEVGRSLLTLQQLSGVILFPIALGFSAIAPTFIELLYGNKWEGLGLVISLLVIMPGLTYMWSLNEKAYQAIGRPDVWTKLSMFTSLSLIALLWMAAPYGLSTFTWARFAGASLVPIGNMLYGIQTLGVETKEQIKSLAFPFFISSLMYGLVCGLIQLGGQFEGFLGWLKLLGIITIGAGTYLILFWRGNRSLWNLLILSIRKIFS